MAFRAAARSRTVLALLCKELDGMATETRKTCAGDLKGGSLQHSRAHRWRSRGYSSGEPGAASSGTALPGAGRWRGGGLSWLAAGSLLGASLVGYGYYSVEVQRARAARLAAAETSVGEAQVGGPFVLKDTAGKRFTDADLKGEFSMLYFGFTHCPDICPDELEKLARAIDMVEGRSGTRVLPVFITVDPERDTPRLLRDYVGEFHPRLLGLRGTPEETRAVAKAYRVYFMKTNDSKDDYLVDHSIIMYLINPDGKFVTFYGKNFSAEQIAESLCQHIGKWKASHGDYRGAPKL